MNCSHRIEMKAPAVALALVLAATSPVVADEIRPPFEVELKAAVMAYREGDFEEAREHTEKALKMLDEMKSGTITATLPGAPEGWRAGDVRKEDIPALFGGGRVVKRLYEKKDGDQRIELEVIFESGISKIMAPLANDAVAESQGFKVRRIGRESALIKETKKGLEIHILVEDKLLVKLTGKGGAEEKEVLDLAREVDLGTLRDLE
jgi:hypothetical protein